MLAVNARQAEIFGTVVPISAMSKVRQKSQKENVTMKATQSKEKI
jgi:hypothetical protein